MQRIPDLPWPDDLFSSAEIAAIARGCGRSLKISITAMRNVLQRAEAALHGSGRPGEPAGMCEAPEAGK